MQRLFAPQEPRQKVLHGSPSSRLFSARPPAMRCRRPAGVVLSPKPSPGPRSPRPYGLPPGQAAWAGVCFKRLHGLSTGLAHGPGAPDSSPPRLLLGLSAPVLHPQRSSSPSSILGGGGCWRWIWWIRAVIAPRGSTARGGAQMRFFTEPAEELLLKLELGPVAGVGHSLGG